MIRYYGQRRARPRATKTAVALEYKRGRDSVPFVTASGRAEIAGQIIEVAQQHGVHIEPDPQLAEILAELDLGQAIPKQVYYVVAEILAFVYKLNSQATAS